MYIYTHTFFFHLYFFFIMAHDEVDPSLITNDHRKRKLPSYATNSNNISADKDEIVKNETYQQCFSNLWAMNILNTLKFSKFNILKNIIVSPGLALLKKMKRRDLQLLPTSIEVLPQTKRWETVHKAITKKPRTFLSYQMKMKTTIRYHLPKNQKAESNQIKNPQSSTLHLMNKSVKSESLIKRSHLKMQWSSTHHLKINMKLKEKECSIKRIQQRLLPQILKKWRNALRRNFGEW